MKLLSSILLLLISLEISAQTFQPTQSPQNSLNWAGSYVGKLPMRDCAGIRTIVQLNNKNEYTLTETALCGSKKAVVKKGSFEWWKDGSRITFKGKSNYQFLVAVDRLIQLDSKGQAIPSKDYETYVLKKSNGDITEKYWKLTEIKAVPLDRAELKKEPYITFRKDSINVQGFAGCNGFGGIYTMGAGQTIKLSKLHATLMACASMQTESGFLKALDAVRYYQIESDVLILQNAEMAPLLRFEVVYLR